MLEKWDPVLGLENPWDHSGTAKLTPLSEEGLQGKTSNN